MARFPSYLMSYGTSRILRGVWGVFLCCAWVGPAVADVLPIVNATDVPMLFGFQSDLPGYYGNVPYGYNPIDGGGVINPGQSYGFDASVMEGSLSGTVMVSGQAVITYSENDASVVVVNLKQYVTSGSPGIVANTVSSTNSVMTYVRSDNGDIRFSGVLGGTNTGGGVLTTLAGLGLTNWGQFTNSSPLIPGADEMRASANQMAMSNDAYFGSGGQAAAPVSHWAGNFSAKLDTFDGSFTNGLNWTNFAVVPDDSHWFSVQMPDTFVPGVGTAEGMYWTVDPAIPGGLQADFNFFCWMVNLVFKIVMGWSLWWFIKQDIEESLMTLASVPQPTNSGTEILGCKLGFVGQVIAAAAVCAALYVFVAAVAGALIAWVMPSGLSDLKAALQSGNGGGYVSVWIPRVASWVFQVFPVVYFFTTVSSYVAYQFTKFPALRLAMVVLKFAQGVL
jgi:hypothetical protein